MPGFVFDLIGRAAEPGDEVRSDGLRFTVLDVEGSRIQRLEVEFLPAPNGPAKKARRRRPRRHDPVGGRFAAPAPRLRPLPRRHARVGGRGRDVLRRDRLAGVRRAGNPFDLGLVGLAMFIPLPLLALPAGHLADRFPRRTLLAIAIALETAVMVGLLGVTRGGRARRGRSSCSRSRRESPPRSGRRPPAP